MSQSRGHPGLVRRSALVQDDWLPVMNILDAGAQESVLLGLPETISPVTEFRSTWVVSSLEGLRLHGHFDRYQALLSAHHDEILDCVAAAWLPVRVVRAHYEACEALALSAEDLVQMVREGGNVRRAWHAAIIAAAQRPDADIWSILKQLQKIWLRGANGGAVAVFQLGPTRARVEYIECQLFDVAYFRSAVSAVLWILGSHMCPNLRVTSLASASLGAANYLLDWS